jgi:hypothetical protein
MGRNPVSIEVTARLSAHNDEQDDIDMEAWERFVAAVRQLANREEYRDINVSVN